MTSNERKEKTSMTEEEFCKLVFENESKMTVKDVCFIIMMSLDNLQKESESFNAVKAIDEKLANSVINTFMFTTLSNVYIHSLISEEEQRKFVEQLSKADFTKACKATLL